MFIGSFSIISVYWFGANCVSSRYCITFGFTSFIYTRSFITKFFRKLSFISVVFTSGFSGVVVAVGGFEVCLCRGEFVGKERGVVRVSAGVRFLVVLGVRVIVGRG